MGIIETNAEKLRQLHLAVVEAWQHRHEGKEKVEEWKNAARVYRDSYDALAFPGGVGTILERLAKHDEDAIERVIRFIEADPWFFRSGYLKQEMLKHLKRAPLNDNQKRRLRGVILKKIEGNPVREFHSYSRLAPSVADEEFKQEVSAFLNAKKSSAVRAQWVLHCLNQPRPLKIRR